MWLSWWDLIYLMKLFAHLFCSESWALKNWCFWTMVLEKTLESPVDCREIQPVHAEGDPCWVFIGRTDGEAETPILWPPDGQSQSVLWLARLKRPWCWERLKLGGEGDNRGWGGWMASPTQWIWVWVNSRSWDGQGGLVCYSPWGHKGSDTTEWLNWTELIFVLWFYHHSNGVWSFTKIVFLREKP